MWVWVGYLKEALERRDEEKFEGMGQFKSQVPRSTSGQGSALSALPSSTKQTRHQK